MKARQGQAHCRSAARNENTTTYQTDNIEMMILAQNYMFAYVLISLGVGLGLLAICIPRRRKKVVVEKKKKLRNPNRKRKPTK